MDKQRHLGTEIVHVFFILCQVAGRTVIDDVDESTGAYADDRNTRRESFHHHKSERFSVRGHHKEICRGKGTTQGFACICVDRLCWVSSTRTNNSCEAKRATYRSFAPRTRQGSPRNASSTLLQRALSPRKPIDSLDCDLRQLSSALVFSLCRDVRRKVTAVPPGGPPREIHGCSRPETKG